MGAVSVPFMDTIFRARPPSAGTRKMSPSQAKNISVPSGDREGLEAKYTDCACSVATANIKTNKV